MSPFFFGADARRLFGIFEPAPTEKASAAVLLCNAFGHEAIHAHRLYRVLAQRLTRAGFDVMRFDYFGTGDSAGDDRDADLDGWTGDVLTAYEELLSRSGSSRAAWLGARLGAPLVARATHRAARTPERVVLWDPIVDGGAYLAEIGALHERTLEISYAGVQPLWRAFPRSASECMGFELAQPLQEGLRALTPETFAAPRALRCEVICGAVPEIRALAAAWSASGLRVDTTLLADAFDWTTEDLESVLVPPDTLARLAEALTRS